MRYIERKVFIPKPTKPPEEVIKRFYVDRTVKIIETEFVERPLGFFARLGDRIDKLYPRHCVQNGRGN